MWFPCRKSQNKKASASIFVKRDDVNKNKKEKKAEIKCSEEVMKVMATQTS